MSEEEIGKAEAEAVNHRRSIALLDEHGYVVLP